MDAMVIGGVDTDRTVPNPILIRVSPRGCQRDSLRWSVKGPRSEKLLHEKKTFRISVILRTPEQSHSGTWDTSLVGLSLH